MNISTLPTSDLQFDGERFIPGAGVDIAYHHWLRYQLAVRLAGGKRVLDVASGEGYGAAMMGRVAEEVTAFDADERAVRHARKAYADRTNVDFQRAELRQFFATAEPRRYDLVTAFEIIEHVDEQAQRELVQGIRRVLAPGGLALISTPDKRLYSDARLSKNPFHVREVYRREFDALLREGFPHVVIMEEVACTGAVTFKAGANQGELTRVAWTDLLRLHGSCEPGLEGEGEYLVAVGSDQPIPERATVALALLDPAKKLIAEELYSMNLTIVAARRTEAALREDLARATARITAAEGEVERLRRTLESAEARASEAETLRCRIEALESVAERFAMASARAQDEITRAQRVESELHRVREQYELDHDALVHLRRMIGVRLALKAKTALDGMPLVKRAVNAVTRRLK